MRPYVLAALVLSWLVLTIVAISVIAPLPVSGCLADPPVCAAARLPDRETRLAVAIGYAIISAGLAIVAIRSGRRRSS